MNILLSRVAFPLFLCLLGFSSLAAPSGNPNILWLSSEDNGPHLGCYGDPVATTPNLDKLAAKGMRYLRASSNAPVCAPARTTIISGIYPPSSGAEHMRSIVPMPVGTKTFPSYLTEVGYRCSNTSKEDYNVQKSPNTWVGKPKGKGFYWEFQQPTENQEKPFFAVYNYTICHESQIRNKIADKDRIHDPKKVHVPAYHPDTPEVRKDWAQYHDRITMMDAMVGKALGALGRSGKAEDTIIFYWGDHGSGMPRSKRWPYNSGLHVPLIAYFPPKWQHLAPKEYKANGTSDRMVGFIDFAPTMLSLAGVKPKNWMQGHAFAGEFEVESPDYSFGFRGRMDERVDMVRSVMDQRYVYLRQYHPHRPYGQYIGYMFITPTTKVWHEKFHAGELNEAQSHFWREKPAEELYDLKTDPDEVNNLVDSAEHQAVLERMRAAHRTHSLAIRDVGFLPESEIHARSVGSTPFDMGRDPEKYDFETVFAAAERATQTGKNAAKPADLVALLGSEDSAVRYWGATGLLIQKKAGVDAARIALLQSLNDPAGAVAAVAAEALGRFGSESERDQALDTLLRLANQKKGDVFNAILAANAIDYMDENARSRLADIEALPRKKPQRPNLRGEQYVGAVLSKALKDLK